MRFAVILVVAAACTVEVEVPDGAVIECSTSAHCLPGFECVAARCIPLSSPRVELGPPLPTGGARIVDAVSVAFTVLDPDGEAVDVSFEYLVPGDATWRAATARADGAALTGVVPGTPATFIWDILADAAPSGAVLVSALLPTDGGTREVTAPVDGVSLRALPVDASGLQGPEVESDPFAIGNEPPAAVVDDPESPQRDQVSLTFGLTDSSSDPADVEVEFCAPPASGPDPCAAGGGWRRAALVGASTDLATGGPGEAARDHLALWDSMAAANADATAPQGVGRVSAADVRLRLRAADAPDGGAPVYSDWHEVTLPVLANQEPPRILQATARRGTLSAGSSPVAITFTVADPESDPVDLSCELFAHDRNLWLPCTELRSPASAGRFDLATSPQGVSHVFVWDPTGQPYPAALEIRLTVSDGTVSPAVPVVLAEGIGVAGAPPDRYLEYRCTTWGGTYPADEIATGDFDDDGRADFVVSSYSSGQADVKTWLGRADGDTNNGVAYVNGGGTQSDVVSCDFNGDGYDDIAASHHSFGSGSVSFLLSNGNGSFAAPQDRNLFSSEPVALAAGYIDRDRACDLIYAIGNEPRFGAVFGSTTLAVENWPFDAYYVGGDFSSRTTDVALGDLNGDGLLDAVAATSRGEVSKSCGTGSQFGAFTFCGTRDYPIGGRPRGLSAGDLDGDGLDDVVFARYDEDGLTLLYSRLGVSLELTDRVDLTVPDRPVSTLIADLTTDGVPDVAVMSRGEGGALTVLEARGGNGRRTAGFATPLRLTANVRGPDPSPASCTDAGFQFVASSLPDFEGAGDIEALDVNGDGITDVVVTDGAEGELEIFWGDHNLYGDGGTYDARAFRPTGLHPLGGHPNDLRSADVDRDGFVDFLAAHDEQVSRLVNLGHQGVGSRTFAPRFTSRSGGVSATLVRAADLDRDGQPDLVSSGSSSNTIAMVMGVTSGAAEELQLPTVDQVVFLEVADIDNNGWLDLVAGGSTAGLIVHWDVGTRDFSNSESLGAPTPFLSFDVADVTADGRLDLVIGTLDFIQVRPYQGGRVFGSEIATSIGPAPVTALTVFDATGDGFADVVFGTSYDLDLGTGGAQSYVVCAGDGAGACSMQPALADIGAAEKRLDHADLDGDGLLDLLAVSSQGLFLLRGNGVGGVPDGRFHVPFALEGPLFTSSDEPVHITDVDADGVLDLGRADSRGVHSYLGISTGWRSNARRLGEGGFRVLGDVVPVGTDRFGVPRTDDFVSLTIARRIGWHTRGFLSLLSAAGLADEPLRPLTAPWSVDGDVHLVRTAEPAGVPTPTGPRLATAPRLGPRAAPSSTTDFTRLGLDLSAASPRAVIVELKILDGHATFDPALVRLFRARPDWLRADEVADDPMSAVAGADAYLPRVADGRGGFRDVIVERPTLEELQRDPDGFDAGTETGERFYVRAADRRVHVLTDRLGVFQAFVAP